MAEKYDAEKEAILERMAQCANAMSRISPIRALQMWREIEDLKRQG